MKIFVFFLLVGLASASFHEALENAVHEFVPSLLEGMEAEVGDPISFAEQIESEVSVVEKLKETIEKVLEKVKGAIGEKKEVRQELLDKLKELREKLRGVLEQARDYLKKIFEKYGFDKKTSNDRTKKALSDTNYKDLLRKLREHLKENVDPELLKEKIEKLFDQGTEVLRMLLKTLKEKGKKKLEILIDTLLGDDDEQDDRESRSIKDYWEKVKDYFKDLKIDLQEKYMKFGEWVKDIYDKGMEHSKDKMENIRAIAKEFMKHAKNASKEVGAEAADFFRQYKDELGIVWDELKDKFNEIKNRND